MTRERAAVLYDALDVESEMDIKEFRTSDHLMQLTCTLALYEPLCDWTIVSTATSTTWREFMSVLKDEFVTRSGESLHFKSPKLKIYCADSKSVCEIVLL